MFLHGLWQFANIDSIKFAIISLNRNSILLSVHQALSLTFLETNINFSELCLIHMIEVGKNERCEF